MRNITLLTTLGFGLLMAPQARAAEVSVGIGIGAPIFAGPAPLCPYGYYPSYPYACAPYGYYGPDWFVGGVFIGAGPWFHGFHGRPDFRPERGRFDHGRVAPAPRAFRGEVNRGNTERRFDGGSGFRGRGRR